MSGRKLKDASATKCPSTCQASMQLIFRVSSIAGPCSGLSRRRSRVRARFSRVHLAQKWAPERAASQPAFLSHRITMKSSEGGGGNARYHEPRFRALTYDLRRFHTPDDRAYAAPALHILSCGAFTDPRSRLERTVDHVLRRFTASKARTSRRLRAGSQIPPSRMAPNPQGSGQ
jgi:hypothetical protein